MIAVFVLSCSSRVYVQKDESASLAKYKTYMWVDTRASEQDTKHTTAFAKQAIHNAADAELAKDGWHEVTQNPDVLISYDILVERTTQQQSSPVYTRPFTRLYYNPYFHRWGTIYYPSQFAGYTDYEVPVREGTITITMMDANSDKTVWQAWTTDEMNGRKLTNEELTRDVRNIFKKFDVAKG
jgi:hypothetical protein